MTDTTTSIEVSCEHPQCGKTFLNKSLLMLHLKIHNEAKKCGHCGKCFVNNQALTRHSVVHTDEKIVCDICGEIFSVKANLVCHKKNKHS